jgi:hypothetical protein
MDRKGRGAESGTGPASALSSSVGSWNHSHGPYLAVSDGERDGVYGHGSDVVTAGILGSISDTVLSPLFATQIIPSA